MNETIQLSGRAGLPEILTTDEAADRLNRRPQTLRKWAALECGPIRPVRINGRLAWRVADLEKLLNGEPLNTEPPKTSLTEKPIDPARAPPERAVRSKRSRPTQTLPLEKA